MRQVNKLLKKGDLTLSKLDGTATVIIDGRVEEIQAGGWHLRPSQIEHTFGNGSEKPLRFIDMYFNQNIEDFLEQLFHKIIPDMIKNNLTTLTHKLQSDCIILKIGLE